MEATLAGQEEADRVMHAWHAGGEVDRAAVRDAFICDIDILEVVEGEGNDLAPLRSACSDLYLMIGDVIR
jgi:hypothetical protein